MRRESRKPSDHDLKLILKSLKSLKAVDASPLFETNMPGWSTHPTMSIVEDARNFRQNGYFAQTLVMSEHTGSHVDAPAHVIRTMPEATIDRYPVDVLMGLSKKYNLKHYKFKAGDQVPLKAIKETEKRAGFRLDRGDIVILQFGWEKYYQANSVDPSKREWWGKNMPGLSAAVCKYFADVGVKAVGSDTAGCDECVIDGQLKHNFGHMKYFLPNHIFIIEGLRNLEKTPTIGIFIALPLKIKGGSGSPIRPIIFG